MVYSCIPDSQCNLIMNTNICQSPLNSITNYFMYVLHYSCVFVCRETMFSLPITDFDLSDAIYTCTNLHRHTILKYRWMLSTWIINASMTLIRNGHYAYWELDIVLYEKETWTFFISCTFYADSSRFIVMDNSWIFLLHTETHWCSISTLFPLKT